MAQYEYKDVGNETAKHLENGSSVIFTHDAANRLTGIEDRRGTAPLASFAYTLDSVGNRKSKTQTGLNPLAESYSYDPADQLIQAKYGTARTVGYQYDATGNRQSVSDNGSSQTYSADALNQYTSAGGNPLTYDANGNLSGGLLNTENGTLKTVAFIYDARNRLTSATVNGTVTTFTHDPRNRVVQRSTDGTTTNLTYDGWNLIEERDAAGALQQVYVHGAAVDELLAKITPAGAVYYHTDALGSTVALTDSTGSAVETYTYDVFGAATIHAPSTLDTRPSSLFANRFLFTGCEWLAEAALYDYRNRAYSPALGRFFQTDPIRFAAGDANIYRYVANNPVNFVDPLGLLDQDVFSSTDRTGGSFRNTNTPNYDFGGHGNPNNMADDRNSERGKGKPLSPNKAADLIKSDPNYHGEPVQLFSCSTGKGNNSFAQKLADKLGVPVTAPTNTLIVDSNGNYRVDGHTGVNNNDGWKTFYPR